MFEAGGTSFHPKAYIITATGGSGTAFVGSSNLSDSALRAGIEWNYRVVTSSDGSGFHDVVHAFEELWRYPQVRSIDTDWVDAYSRRRKPPPPRVVGVLPEPVGPPPEPHPIQQEALAALEATRDAGNTAGLVVLATGLGKTWLSAFDTQRAEAQRVLFIAPPGRDPRAVDAHVPLGSALPPPSVTTLARTRRRTPTCCSRPFRRWAARRT